MPKLEAQGKFKEKFIPSTQISVPAKIFKLKIQFTQGNDYYGKTCHEAGEKISP